MMPIAGCATGERAQLHFPAREDRRTACKPLQTVPVEGADAREAFVSRIASDLDMAHLGVEHAAEGAPARDDTTADTGADRYVGERFSRFHRAEPRLRQGRGIDIGIDCNRAETLQRLHQRHAGPARLGSGEKGAPGKRAPIDVHRPEGRHTDTGERASQRGFRSRRRNDLPPAFRNLHRSVAGDADEFGAAGLDCPVNWSRIHQPPRYFPVNMRLLRGGKSAARRVVRHLGRLRSLVPGNRKFGPAPVPCRALEGRRFDGTAVRIAQRPASGREMRRAPGP